MSILERMRGPLLKRALRQGVRGAVAALGPTSATIKVTDGFGTTVCNFTGLQPGEKVVSVSPANGKVVPSATGLRAVVGLVASTAGVVTYTFTTSAGKTFDVAVTAANQVIPFTFDASTLFWDFTAADCLIDTVGSDTVSWAMERIAGVLNSNQPVKGWQPLQVAKGIAFNTSTPRHLLMEQRPTVTNAKNGYYLAFVITPASTTSGTIVGVTGPTTSTTLYRCNLDFTSSRNLRLRIYQGDTGSVITVFTSAALTLGATYAVEVLLDFDADMATLWLNGVNQNVTVTGTPWVNFPASNPNAVIIGNNLALTGGFDGVMNNLVFYDGVPGSTIRQSISDFEQARRAA